MASFQVGDLTDTTQLDRLEYVLMLVARDEHELEVNVVAVPAGLPIGIHDLDAASVLAWAWHNESS
jgi:hypothetical protein